jgi:hypothetical protein
MLTVQAVLPKIVATDVVAFGENLLKTRKLPTFYLVSTGHDRLLTFNSDGQRKTGVERREVITAWRGYGRLSSGLCEESGRRRHHSDHCDGRNGREHVARYRASFDIIVRPEAVLTVPTPVNPHPEQKADWSFPEFSPASPVLGATAFYASHD